MWFKNKLCNISITVKALRVGDEKKSPYCYRFYRRYELYYHIIRYAQKKSSSRIQLGNDKMTKREKRRYLTFFNTVFENIVVCKIRPGMILKYTTKWQYTFYIDRTDGGVVPRRVLGRYGINIGEYFSLVRPTTAIREFETAVHTSTGYVSVLINNDLYVRMILCAHAF